MIFFFLFKPYRNLVHWNTELTALIILIFMVSAITIVGLNVIVRYKRTRELSLHTKIFWVTILTILVLLLIMCYRNSEFLAQEGGAGAWLILIVNGLFWGILFSYVVYTIYAILTPLRRYFIFEKMKSLFIM